MWKKSLCVLAMLLLAGAVTGLVAAACSSGNGSSCDSDADCEQGEYCANDGKCHPRSQPDGGDEDGATTGDDDQPADTDQGPPPCEHDRDCPPDQVCDGSDCVAGDDCSADYNCDIATEYCHPEGKVCKQRSQLCEPCAQDYECPDPGEGDMCVVYPGGQSYCGKACGNQGCPPGYVCDPDYGSGTGPNPYQCVSNTGDCGDQFVCHSDEDCAANQVCNLAQGTCVPKCIDDTSCAAGLKCHYTGHCAEPCSTDADCEGDLICCTPGRGFCGPDSTGKCRPEGCVLHSECLLAEGDSLGYCDKTTHECKTGCRAADPNTVNDCKSGMKCTCVNGSATCDEYDCCGDPGQPCLCDPTIEDCSEVEVCTDGLCEEIPCHERGDVSIACGRNQVCCGWPLNDGYDCPQGVDEGECYTAEDPVCRSCSEDAECDVAGYGFGEKGVCLEDTGDGNSYCHLGCRTSQDCPSTWQCAYTYVQGCEQADHCEPSASCETVIVTEEGEEHKGCHCLTDDDCPDDANGFEAHCEPMQICDYSVDPPDCHEGNVCKYAKACQCGNCCSQLVAGG